MTIDIVSFCDQRRSDYVRQHIRRALYELLRKSFEYCQISTNDYYHEDRGDGVVVAIAPAVRTAVLVSSLIDWLHSGVRRHNEMSSEVAQIQLRIGVHTGEADTDDNGIVGTAVNHVFRLLDAPMLKQMLAESTAAIALITSDRVYEDVIRHYPDLVEPADYQLITVDTKETVAPAWVRLVGRAEGPGPSFRKPPAAPVRSLGRPLTSFVGRERDLSNVHELITHGRLVTLIGPGGAGKTRLAEEATRSLIDEFSPVCADGAYMVDLAGYRAGDDLCLALLTTLRLATRSYYGPPGRGPSDDALVAALDGQRVLLVLDNCEQLLDDVAILTETLLTRTETLTLLVTSREALEVPGETTFALRPLALPKPDDSDEDNPELLLRYPAVRLFVDRARSADPGFQLTVHNCADVTQICRRLDGLPLPIELAAARVRVLSPSQIAEKLADRFRVLAHGPRTMPRHRTLQAVVDWSHDLLDAPTSEVFAFLSVFRGGFPLSAVENFADRLGLCPATTAELVVRLVDKSLVQATPADDGPMRYWMLETLREYAADRLAERALVEKAGRHHAEMYVELAEEQSPALRTSSQSEAIRTLEREDGNLRAAFEFSCRTGNHDLALRLVAALGWYLWMRGDRAFGWPGVARALSIHPHQQNPIRRAHALIWSCHLGSVGHRAVEPQAREHGQQARVILENLRLTNSVDYGYSMFVSAFSAYREDRHAEGNALVARALQLGTELRDPWLTACATCVAGIGHALRGEFTASAHQLITSAQHYRNTGDAWGQHRALIWLSRTYESIGDLPQAQETAETAITLVRSLELSDAVVPLLGWLARLRILDGNQAGATSTLAALKRNHWWRSTSEGIGWITDCHALLAEDAAYAQPNDTNNTLLRQAATLYRQASTELAAAGLPIHAIHSRCRQAAILARIGEPAAEALHQATQLAKTQSDRRAQAIILDTMSLTTVNKDTSAQLLSQAESCWQRTNTSRSPRFAADIEQLRNAILPEQ